MGDMITEALGGKTQAQKDQEAQIAQQQADALQQKITAIQGTVGSQTRDLVMRYGVSAGGLAGPST